MIYKISTSWKEKNFGWRTHCKHYSFCSVCYHKDKCQALGKFTIDLITHGLLVFQSDKQWKKKTSYVGIEVTIGNRLPNTSYVSSISCVEIKGLSTLSYNWYHTQKKKKKAKINHNFTYKLLEHILSFIIQLIRHKFSGHYFSSYLHKKFMTAK